MNSFDHLRNRARRANAAVVALSLSIFVFALRETLANSRTSYALINAGAALLMVIGGGSLLLMYLRGDLLRSASASNLAPGLASVSGAGESEIYKRLSELEARLAIARTEALAITEAEKHNLIAAIRADMSTEVGAEFERKYAAAAMDDAFLQYVRKVTDTTYLRLTTEIESLGRRGSLNLVIGSSVTISAVALLAYMVLSEHSTFKGLTDLLASYIPRITTVIFVEIFAFFFLRLYKSALEDTKYYQNELIAVSAQAVAMQGALLKGDATARNIAIEKLITIDRNATYGKETSTEIDAKDIVGLLERFAKVTAKKQP